MYTLLLFLALSLTSSAAVVHGDEGCGLDPFGRCNTAALGDSGPGMDPNGLAATDDGPYIDPNGR